MRGRGCMTMFFCVLGQRADRRNIDDSGDAVVRFSSINLSLLITTHPPSSKYPSTFRPLQTLRGGIDSVNKGKIVCQVPVLFNVRGIIILQKD